MSISLVTLAMSPFESLRFRIFLQAICFSDHVLKARCTTENAPLRREPNMSARSRPTTSEETQAERDSRAQRAVKHDVLANPLRDLVPSSPPQASLRRFLPPGEALPANFDSVAV